MLKRNGLGREIIALFVLVQPTSLPNHTLFDRTKTVLFSYDGRQVRYLLLSNDRGAHP